MARLLVIQHLEREGPGLFAEAATARGWALQIVRPDLGEPFPTPAATDVVLVLGGPMGVAQIGDPAYPWLAREVAWLRDLLVGAVPVVGVCLGAQLLVHAAGGQVEPLTLGEPPVPVREVGWGAVSFTVAPEQEPLLRGLHPSELMLHWHGDRVRLPAGARLLGSTQLCPEQIFQLGGRAFGLQCHVEVRPEDLGRWLAEDGDYVIAALGAQGPQRILAEERLWGERTRRQGRRLIDNLLDALIEDPRPSDPGVFSPG